MIHCYKLCGYNVVLDIASGAIHCVDDVAYDVIRGYELVLDGKDRSVLVNRVLENHKGITEADVLEVISDIETLISQRKLFSSDSFLSSTSQTPTATPPTTQTPTQTSSTSITRVKALCLNVSHACNMSCAYCFASCQGCQGDGSTDRETPSLLMNFETGKRAIDFLFKKSGDKTNLDVDFFGGEPLLNWEVVKEIVRYARGLERQSKKKFRFTLTTNGLLIDDDVISFTNNQMHNVVLSLDGRIETHDAMRKLPDGNGSFRAVADNIKKLVDARRGKGYYIRGTFTRENMDFVNDILFLANLGYKEISLEPVVEKAGHESRESPICFSKVDLPALFEQYEVLAVEMLRREKIGVGFNFYHYNLDLTGGPCVHKRIAGCGVGTEYLAVTPSGELYPCHQFIGDTKFLIGDVWQGVTNTTLQGSFVRSNIFTRSECRECWVRFYCSGGCAANAYNDTGNINGIYEFGCELFKKRIECAIMMKVAKET